MASIDRDKLGEHLSAYLDDELPQAEREVLERLIARDQATRKQLEELRQAAELVRGLPRRSAPPSLVEDLTAAAERRALLGEPDEAGPPRRPWWYSARSWLSAAAVVVITVGGGWYVFEAMREPTGPRLAEAPAPTPTGGLQHDADVTSESGAVALAPKEAAGERGPVPAEFDEAEGARHAAVRRLGKGLDVAALDKAADLEAVEAKAEGLDTRPGSELLAWVAPSAVSERYDRLGGVLTLEQKLEAGFSNVEMVQHRFDNESNIIVVQAGDRQDEGLAREQITRFTMANSLRDLSKIAPSEQLAANVPLMFEGRQPENFEANDQMQFVVHMPRESLGELVEALNPRSSGLRVVELDLGPVSATTPVEIERLVDNVASSRRDVRAVPGDMVARAPVGTDHGTPVPPAGLERRRRGGRGAGEKKRSTQTYGGGKARPAPERAASQPTSAPSRAEGRDSMRDIIDGFFRSFADIESTEPPPEPEESPTPDASRGSRRRAKRLDRDDFVTVVVQVLRAKIDGPLSTQPASTEAGN